MYHYSLRTATKGHAPQWVYVSVIFVCSLLARPAQGAATTVDIRCTSSLADTETVPLLLRKATRDRILQWICVSVICVCSLLARPAQGAATTDVCLVRTSTNSHRKHIAKNSTACNAQCVSPEGVDFSITPVWASVASTDWGNSLDNVSASKRLTSIFDAHKLEKCLSAAVMYITIFKGISHHRIF